MKERIIEQTACMFARDGVKAVRMDDIAAEMGISKRTIYEIFGDKETLITECFHHYHRKMKAENAELTRGTDNIIAEFLIQLEIFDKRMEETGRIIDDVRKFYPHIYENFMRDHAYMEAEELRRKLRHSIDTGYLMPTLDIDMVLIIFMHTMYGAMKTTGLLVSNITQREVFKFFTTHFIRGIATQKGIELIDKKLNNG
jgi:AcrR family transcriptional regulator